MGSFGAGNIICGSSFYGENRDKTDRLQFRVYDAVPCQWRVVIGGGSIVIHKAK